MPLRRTSSATRSHGRLDCDPISRPASGQHTLRSRKECKIPVRTRRKEEIVL